MEQMGRIGLFDVVFAVLFDMVGTFLYNRRIARFKTERRRAHAIIGNRQRRKDE